MNRRTVLRSGAVATAGGLATLAGLRFSSEEASAASTALDVAGDQALVDSDGDLAAVWLDCDVEWAYELPDGVQPSTVIVELAAAEAGESLTVVDSADSAEMFLQADGEESFSVDLLAEGVLSADAITPDSGERSTDVEVESRLFVENADGTVLAEADASDTATLSIERAIELDPSEYGSVGGSGGLTIETTE